MSQQLYGARLDAAPSSIQSEVSLRVVARPVPQVDLDIVIPALDEEHRIGATIAQIVAELEDAPFTARLIVVDNGCVDATVDVVESFDHRIPLDVISCASSGKGAAVRAGMAHTTAPYVAYCDADLSTPPRTLRQGMDLVQGGARVVIGSRHSAGATIEVSQSLLRRVGSRAFNRAASSLVGELGDTQCGFKMLEGSLARWVFPRMRLHGYAFDVELIARLQRAEIELVELPVIWSDDKGTRLNILADGYRAFRDLVVLHRTLSSEASRVRV